MMQLSAGFDTIIGNQGVKRSGAQRQRSAIARLGQYDLGWVRLGAWRVVIDWNELMACRLRIFTLAQAQSIADSRAIAAL